MRDPVIVLAGRKWCIPLLAPRQNRIIVPSLLALQDSPEEWYDGLFDIVFAALTRAEPGLVRDDLEDWTIATHELIDALPVIAKQTGLCRNRDGTGHRVPRDAMPCPLPDWDAIIAEVVNFLPGTTPDYWEDALTIPRLEALREQWRLHPPPAVLLAAWLGYRPRARDEDALAELLRLFPSGALKLN